MRLRCPTIFATSPSRRRFQRFARSSVSAGMGVSSVFAFFNTIGADSPVDAAQPPPIFDYEVREQGGYDGANPAPGVIMYVPFAGWDYPALDPTTTNTYTYQYSRNWPVSFFLEGPTVAPTASNSSTAATVANTLSWLNSNNEPLNYVMSDFEPYNGNTQADVTAQVDDVVKLVRASPNSNISSAYVGNYADYAGGPNNSLYLSAGLNIGMPNAYAYADYETNSGNPNARSALFWTPLNMITTAEKDLPTGNKLIPWLSNYVEQSGYADTPPTVEDNVALIADTRLRGANGYYDLGGLENYTFAWTDLNWLYDGTGSGKILNLTTDQSTGFQWSGYSNGTNVALMFDNLGNSAASVTLPTMSGVPASSPTIAVGTHVEIFYANDPAQIGSDTVYLGRVNINSSLFINSSVTLNNAIVLPAPASSDLPVVTIGSDMAGSDLPVFAGTIALSDNVDLQSAASTTTFSGVISGTGNVTTGGAGTVVLSAANTYTGNTNISAGTLSLSNGTNRLPITTILSFTGNGTLNLGNNSQTVAGIGVSQGSNGSLTNGTLTTTGAVVFTATGASVSNLSGGSIVNPNGVVLDASAAGGSAVATGVVINVGSQITGSHGLTIKAFGNTSDNGSSNSALFNLTNSANNFTGGVSITEGLVNVSVGDGIFNNASNASTNTISIGSGAGLVTSSSVTLNSSSIVLTGAGSHYIRPYGGAVVKINGNISGANSSAGLYLVDGGVTVLAGTNSYLGATTIDDGGVVVTGNESTANGGWNIGIHSAYGTTVSFNASSVVNVNATGSVVIGTIPTGVATSSANETLNDESSVAVTNAGGLSIGRTGILNINSGASWNQSGMMSVQPVNGSGYSAYVNVNSGGTFNYNGSTGINLTPSIQNGGYAQILIAGGTFNTSQGFMNGAYSTVSGNSYNSSGDALIQLTNGGSIVLSADIANLTTTNGSTFNIVVGNDSGGVINTNGFNTAINSVISNASSLGTLTKDGGGGLTLGAANTYTGGTTVDGGALVLAAGLVSAGTGNITINGGGVIVRSSNLTTVSNLIQTGMNAGGKYWNGPGINSFTAANDSTHLTALGAILNDNGSGAPLYGVSGTIAPAFEGVSPLDEDILVKYTYYGDTDLNGKVDGSDYSRIDVSYLDEADETTPFSVGVTGWFNGDFNYDGIVNGSDYTLMDNAFNSQGSQISAEIASPTSQVAAVSLAGAVPEPTMLCLVGVGSIGLLGRRSRYLRYGRFDSRSLGKILSRET